MAAWALLPLRLFFGATFLYAGVDKLILDRGFFDPNSPSSIQSQFAIFERVSPLAPLVHLLEPFAVPLGVLIALGEIGAGLGALTGLAFRLSAVGGAMLSLLFFLTASWSTHPYYFGPDLPYALGWVTLALAGHGDFFVLRIARSHPAAAPSAPPSVRAAALSRRAVLQVAALTGLAVGLASVLGALRWLTPDAGAATGGPSPGPTTTPLPNVNGVEIANASDFSSAAARRFNVPITAPAPLPAGDPALIIRLDDGSFVAYDALCTHEACRVGWSTAAAVIVCPCHGAEFDAADHGAVLAGPTNIPLPELPLFVNPQSGAITLRYD